MCGWAWAALVHTQHDLDIGLLGTQHTSAPQTRRGTTRHTSMQSHLSCLFLSIKQEVCLGMSACGVFIMNKGCQMHHTVIGIAVDFHVYDITRLSLLVHTVGSSYSCCSVLTLSQDKQSSCNKKGRWPGLFLQTYMPGHGWYMYKKENE